MHAPEHVCSLHKVQPDPARARLHCRQRARPLARASRTTRTHANSAEFCRAPPRCADHCFSSSLRSGASAEHGASDEPEPARAGDIAEQPRQQQQSPQQAAVAVAAAAIAAAASAAAAVRPSGARGHRMPPDGRRSRHPAACARSRERRRRSHRRLASPATIWWRLASLSRVISLQAPNYGPLQNSAEAAGVGRVVCASRVAVAGQWLSTCIILCPVE